MQLGEKKLWSGINKEVIIKAFEKYGISNDDNQLATVMYHMRVRKNLNCLYEK